MITWDKSLKVDDLVLIKRKKKNGDVFRIHELNRQFISADDIKLYADYYAGYSVGDEKVPTLILVKEFSLSFKASRPRTKFISAAMVVKFIDDELAEYIDNLAKYIDRITNMLITFKLNKP